MGCANSKQKRCRHCNSAYSPVPRSNSMNVHHPPQTKDDSYHVVALKSTTLGSLEQISHHHNYGNGFKFSNDKVSDSDKTQNQDEKSIGEAKAWSNMIEQKLPKATVPKTPTRTPSCEPETINTWELMEGLEDMSPLRSPIHFKSFSFDVNNNHVVELDPHKCSSFIENGTASPKPMWLQVNEEGSRSNLKPEVSDFDDPRDHDVSSLFHKLLREKQESMVEKGFPFEEKKISGDGDGVVVGDFKATPCGKDKDKVVLYFTSLRGVRKTYEDCCHVRLILKGLGVKVDERDVSMHSGFKEELKELLGHGLPRVFVGGNYIGGAEEIQKLHEDGKLEKLFDCCEKIDGNVGGDALCEACGDIRFVPCETCYGSCKIYYESNEEEEEDDDHGEEGEYGFQRCPDCNENGLIRCPICCY